MTLQEIMNKYPITVGKDEQITNVAKIDGKTQFNSHCCRR